MNMELGKHMHWNINPLGSTLKLVRNKRKNISRLSFSFFSPRAGEGSLKIPQAISKKVSVSYKTGCSNPINPFLTKPQHQAKEDLLKTHLTSYHSVPQVKVNPTMKVWIYYLLKKPV
jgi:hypothetical protein